MRLHTHPFRVISIVVVLGLLGCSSNQYKEPIHAFSEAAEANASALSTWKNDYDRFTTEAGAIIIAHNTESVDFDPRECKIGMKSESCLLHVDKKAFGVADTNATKLFELSSRLTTYASQLTAVVDSTSVEDFNTSAHNLALATDELSSAIDSETKAGPYVSIIEDFAKFTGDLALENKKVQALKVSVPHADQWISKLPGWVAPTLDEGRQHMLDILASETLDAVLDRNHAKPDPKDSTWKIQHGRKTSLLEINERVAELHRLSRLQITPIMQHLADAHHALTQLVIDPKTDKQAILAQIRAAIASLKDIKANYEKAD